MWTPASVSNIKSRIFFLILTPQKCDPPPRGSRGGWDQKGGQGQDRRKIYLLPLVDLKNCCILHKNSLKSHFQLIYEVKTPW